MDALETTVQRLWAAPSGDDESSPPPGPWGTRDKAAAQDHSLRLLIEQLPAVVWSTDTALLLTSSAGAGLSRLKLAPDASVGLTLFTYFQTDKTECGPIAAHLRALQGEAVNFEVEWLGRTFQAHVEPCRGPDGSVTGTVGVALDITDRKRAEEYLRQAALRDPLTGLPNRTLFLERLAHVLIQSRRRAEHHYAVLLLDLDRFQAVNDSLGPLAGDRFLAAVARRLRDTLRPEDTLARFGGDEFAIVLEDVRQPADAVRVAERCQRALSGPITLDGQEFYTTASIGVALGSRIYDRPEALLRDADTAMYRAKALGRASYQIFDQEMHTRTLARTQLERELRHALERHELRVLYQPIVSLGARRVEAVEGLLRWQHPKRGLLSPGEFLPLAEETGLILPIGRWVLDEGCLQVRAWREGASAEKRLAFSVNLSGRQLREPAFVQDVERALDHSGLAGRHLGLEVTEDVMMEDADAAGELLAGMRKREMEVSIDDFGTGHSSLAQLHRLPVDTLKIDRSFVGRIAQRDKYREIVRTIVSLGHNLGLKVVAEGVETSVQLDELREMGCDYGQGFYFSRPVEAFAAGPMVLGGDQ